MVRTRKTLCSPFYGEFTRGLGTDLAEFSASHHAHHREETEIMRQDNDNDNDIDNKPDATDASGPQTKEKKDKLRGAAVLTYKMRLANLENMLACGQGTLQKIAKPRKRHEKRIQNLTNKKDLATLSEH
mgnify:CR=1 FL=1